MHPSDLAGNRCACRVSGEAKGDPEHVSQALKIAGVSEDQVSVVELDCPPPAWFGDTSVSDGDGVSGRIAEVIDDGAKAFVTAAGVHPHTLAHREVEAARHNENLLRGNLWTPHNPSAPLVNDLETVDDWAATDLAWELVDAISPLLAERDRGQLYAAVGSGDSYAAIDTVLQTMARQGSPIPSELLAKLTSWLDAYIVACQGDGTTGLP